MLNESIRDTAFEEQLKSEIDVSDILDGIVAVDPADVWSPDEGEGAAFWQKKKDIV